MFASKCGKGAAELIEPGDGDRPEKNHNRMEKKNGCLKLAESCRPNMQFQSFDII